MAAEDFDQLYHSQYGNVVAMAYALTGDLAEAQDLAQEAFCRAWQRWRTVSGYDEPLAWVRRVVANLAASRWRRLRVARKYLWHEPEPHAAARAGPGRAGGRASPASAGPPAGDRPPLPRRPTGCGGRPGARGARRHRQVLAASQPGRPRRPADHGGGERP